MTGTDELRVAETVLLFASTKIVALNDRCGAERPTLPVAVTVTAARSISSRCSNVSRPAWPQQWWHSIEYRNELLAPAQPTQLTQEAASLWNEEQKEKQEKKEKKEKKRLQQARTSSSEPPG